MIRRRNKERDDSTIDITPMLDIVFIMLIFFIVTTSFVKETGVEVNRPNASTAVRDERGNILIAITANDEIWIDKRRVDLRSVRANVERLKAENPEREQEPGPPQRGECGAAGKGGHHVLGH